MSVALTCPRCGAAVPPSAGATCPRCSAPASATLSLPADAPAADTARSTPGGPLPWADPVLPARVGRFEVRGLLGEGTFGEVYRGYDPHLDREVALKVAKPGVLGTPARVRRFLREAKAAANLRHPHIVPLYETGEDAGQPFLVSAFIPGRTLAEVLESDAPAGLPPAEAAGLARKLASALAYAHAEGVVHRDVKPENVLVDAKGDPHLLDFGLAARAQPGEEKLTQAGVAVGSPAYMSPEQTRGESDLIGPASDQYALGCTLYELLTGRTPFTGPPDVQILLHQTREPASPRSVNRAVPRDLETICLKCLAKDPQKRYRDCRALADDLRRFLEGEPITARRAGPVERLGRWARRNPVVAGLAAAVFVTLAAGASVATWQAARATAAVEAERTARAAEKEAADLAIKREAEAREAEAKAKKARARADDHRRIQRDVRAFFQEVLSKYVKEEQRDGVKKALEAATAMFVERAKGNPLEEGMIRQLIGNTLCDLGAYPEAEAQLKLAIALLEKVPDDPEHNELSSLADLARVNYMRGDYAAAADLYRTAVERYRKVLGPNAGATLGALSNCGEMLRMSGKPDEAEPLLREAVEGYRKLAEEDTRFDRSLAFTTMNNLALLYGDRGEYRRSEELLREALAGQRQTLGPRHARTLLTQLNLGEVLMHLERYPEAEKELVAALAGQREVNGNRHRDTLFAINNLATLYSRMGRADRAEELLREAAAGFEAVFGDGNRYTLQVTTSLGILLMARRKNAEAEPFLRHAVAGHRLVHGPRSAQLARALGFLAAVYTNLGRYDEADRTFAEAIEVARAAHGPRSPAVLNHQGNRATVLMGLGRLPEAEALLKQVLADLREVAGEADEATLDATETLIDLYESLNRHADAEALYRQAADARRRKFGPEHAETALGLALLANCLITQAKYADAEAVLRECLAIRSKLQPDAWSTANTRAVLGGALFGQKRYAEAEPLLREGYDRLKAMEAKIPPAVRRDRLRRPAAWLAELYAATGRPDEAALWRAEAAKYPEPAPAPRPVR